MSEKQGYRPPIIDHVPSQDELAAATQAGSSEEVTDHAIPREHMDAIMNGMGYSLPERVVSEPSAETTARQPMTQGRDILPPKPTPAGLKDMRASRAELREWLEEDKRNNPST